MYWLKYIHIQAKDNQRTIFEWAPIFAYSSILCALRGSKIYVFSKQNHSDNLTFSVWLQDSTLLMPVKQIGIRSLRNPAKLDLVETVDIPPFRHVSAGFHHVAAEAASAILQNRNGSKLPASPDCATLHHEFASFHYNFATFHHILPLASSWKWLHHVSPPSYI